jgi:hypothetical protein
MWLYSRLGLLKVQKKAGQKNNQKADYDFPEKGVHKKENKDKLNNVCGERWCLHTHTTTQRINATTNFG